jgi:hypothetical protein
MTLNCGSRATCGSLVPLVRLPGKHISKFGFTNELNVTPLLLVKPGHKPVLRSPRLSHCSVSLATPAT